MAETKSESSELKDGEKVELRGAITSKPSSEETEKPAEKPNAKPAEKTKPAEKSQPVDISALENAPAARQNVSSITSAAPIKRDLTKFYLSVGLMVSAGLVVLLGVLYAAKLAEAATLERDLNDEKAYSLELRERLNALGY